MIEFVAEIPKEAGKVLSMSKHDEQFILVRCSFCSFLLNKKKTKELIPYRTRETVH